MKASDLDRWSARLADTRSAGGSRAERVCELCVGTVPVTGGGVSVTTRGGQLATLCATDEVAARIEELQFVLGEGPCVDAIQTGAPLLVSDVLDPPKQIASRWPGFLDAAAEAGVRAVFGFPLHLGAIRVGALDLYRTEPGLLSDGEMSAVRMAADTIALSLPLHLGPGQFVDDKAERSSYRLEVHQAAGMVAVQLDISLGEALVRLRAHAFSQDIPLAQVAVDVVARRLRLSDGDANE